MDDTSHRFTQHKGLKVRYMQRRKIYKRIRLLDTKTREMQERETARQLENFVASLKSQGILDDGVDALLKLKDDHDPKLVRETITAFFKEAELTIYDIQKAVRKDPVEYSKVVASANKLKGTTASIGGCKVAAACEELRQAGEDENNERSIDALKKVICEYEVLYKGLALICRMEKRMAPAKVKNKEGGQA